MLFAPIAVLSLVAAQQPKQQPTAVTPEQVAAKVKLLSVSKPFDDRKAAASWFVKHAAEPALVEACKALENSAAFDESPEIRGYAVFALGRITAKRKLPCPQVIVDALFDCEPDEEYPEVRHVTYYATAALHEFKTPPPGLLPVVVRLLRSPDRTCRVDGLVQFNSLTRGDLDSRKLLESQPVASKLVIKATRDPELEVRRVAIYSHFKLTNDTAEFLNNALRHQEDVAALPELPLVATQVEKNKRASYNLGRFGVATMMATRQQESPKEVLEGCRKLLASSDARSRRLMAEHIGRLAVAATEPVAEPNSGGLDLKSLDNELDTKKLHAANLLIARDAGIRDRLKVLAEEDDDSGVRTAAKLASHRIAKLSEK